MLDRRSVLTTLALAPLAAACSRRGAASTAHDAPLRERSVADVAAAIASGQLTVIDVNRRSRYEEGHVPGARWAQFNRVTAADLPADRNTPLMFYCANEH